MDQGWAAIIAATAAGVFGITGILTGITVGRRQTTDQADVEHQQWLRGQRQDAYVQLLDAWDQAVDALDGLADEWAVIEVEMDAQGQMDFFQQTIHRRAEAARQVMVKPLDRVALLGPGEVDRSVAGMDTAFDEAQAWLGRQADPRDSPQPWGQWTRLLTILHDERRGFLEATKAEMRRSPRPGR